MKIKIQHQGLINIIEYIELGKISSLKSVITNYYFLEQNIKNLAYKVKKKKMPGVGFELMSRNQNLILLQIGTYYVFFFFRNISSNPTPSS